MGKGWRIYYNLTNCMILGESLADRFMDVKGVGGEAAPPGTQG